MKTYFHRSTAEANGIHAATQEVQLGTTAGAGAGSISSSALAGGAAELCFCFTTPSGEPNVADWPSGPYRCILEISAAGADLSYGLRASGAATGHFARVNTGLTSDLQTWAQTDALFTGTGVKVATTGTIDPSAGNASDRFECLVAVSRPATHGNQTLTAVVDATDADATNGGVSDGPWSTDASVTLDGIAAASARGDVAPLLSVALTGAASTAEGGTLAPDTTFPVSPLLLENYARVRSQLSVGGMGLG